MILNNTNINHDDRISLKNNIDDSLDVFNSIYIIETPIKTAQIRLKRFLRCMIFFDK